MMSCYIKYIYILSFSREFNHLVYLPNASKKSLFNVTILLNKGVKHFKATQAIYIIQYVHYIQ